MTRPIPRLVHSPDGKRLPWLADDAPVQDRPARSSSVGLVGWLVVALIVLAFASYRAGLQSVAPRAPPAVTPVRGEISVSLPEARRVLAETAGETAAPRPQEPAQPAAADASGTYAAVAETRPKATSPARQPSSTETDQKPTPGDPYPLWAANKVESSDGRLVRIGSFESEAGAGEGWDKILREYPGMARLKRVVVSGKSLRDGRTFYRLQVGTSSQAHSNVVCQRSRRLGLGCSVVGLVVTGGA